MYHYTGYRRLVHLLNASSSKIFEYDCIKERGCKIQI